MKKQTSFTLQILAACRLWFLTARIIHLKRFFGKPENMTGTSGLKPSKVAVDHSGRIYLVVQSSYEGIIELNKDGSFQGISG
jgi:hypothetical protein